jgi:hypothetical protein
MTKPAAQTAQQPAAQQPMALDDRYTFNFEFVKQGGDTVKQAFAVRWCGDLISHAATLAEAQAKALDHATGRPAGKVTWALLHRADAVLLLRANNSLRVVYGAEVRRFPVSESSEALQIFGECLHHALEAESLLDPQ